MVWNDSYKGYRKLFNILTKSNPKVFLNQGDCKECRKKYHDYNKKTITYNHHFPQNGRFYKNMLINIKLFFQELINCMDNCSLARVKDSQIKEL